MNDSQERRHFAALAMQGLLADHKDHEDERKFEYVECSAHELGAECFAFDAKLNAARFRFKRYTETCAQAVARLAVEHADALIAELNKETK